MISVLEQTNTTRAVYFNDDGIITSITGKVDENNTDMFAFFEIETVMPFIEGTYKFTDYTVKRTDNPLLFEIIKRKVNIKQRNVENQIAKIIEVEDADINVEITDDAIVISASDALVDKSGVDENQNVIVAGATEHPFFITHKDKPEFLISTELVKFSDLLSGKQTVINYEHKYDVSVYTRRYFDSYSLRRV